MAIGIYTTPKVHFPNAEMCWLYLAVPLKSISVHATVQCSIASVCARLHYENQSEAAIEPVLVLPMGRSSAVYSMEVEIDGRTIVAECQEKSQVLNYFITIHVFEMNTN